MKNYYTKNRQVITYQIVNTPQQAVFCKQKVQRNAAENTKACSDDFTLNSIIGFYR
jgi:hypothetical protein